MENAQASSSQIVWDLREGPCLAITNGLIVGYQFLVPCDALLVGQALEDEMIRLPLQSVGPLAAQIRQESFADVEIMADVHPFVASAEAIDSRLLRCVADDAGPCEGNYLLD